MAVALHQIILLDLGQIALGYRLAGSSRENGIDILMLHAPVLGEELQTVAVIGQMAGGNHDGAIHAGFREHRGHEHGRGGSHTAVHSDTASGSQSLQHSLLESRGRNAGIVSHRHPQLLLLLAGLLSEEFQKASGNDISRLYRKSHRLIGHAFHSYPSHITAIGKFLEYFFRY